MAVEPIADRKLARFLPFLFGLLTVAAILAVVLGIDGRASESFRRAGVLARMDLTRAKLEQALQDGLQLARGLAAFVMSRDGFTDDEFLRFANALERDHKGVRSLQLAPKGVITYLTKPELNESVRGLDLLANPRSRATVQLAIDERRLIIAGPLELIQGGVAIIGRLPIYKPNEQGVERFWGFATVLLELEPLLVEAGIGTEEHGLDYALRSADTENADSTLYVGDATVFDRALAIQNIAVPNGNWHIAAVPNRHWPGVWPGRHWLWMIGSSLAVMAGILFYTLIRRPMVLKNRVDQATQALRLSEERYKTLATIAPVGIYQLAGGTELVFMNEQWSRITGVTGKRFDNDSYRKMAHPDDLEATSYAWKRLLENGEPFSLEYRFTQPDGKEIWLLETAMPQKSDDLEKSLIIASVVDITDRKTAEMEVVRSNAELEQFALIVSHDLKAPLRAVSGYCSVLQEEYSDRLDDTAQGYIRSAVEGTARMRRLIEGLLEFSRAGSREQVIETVGCAEVVETVLSDLGFEMEQLGAKTDIRELPTLRADRSELGQLFQNLITNSLNYRKDEPPEITISSEKQGGDWCISVSDNGIGVSDEHAESVFGVFKRLHSREEYSGTGIGLAICRKITERNGGRIWFDKEYEGGAKVCFTWPAEL